MTDRQTHQNPLHLHGAWTKLVDGRVLVECSGGTSEGLWTATLDVTTFAHILARDLLVAHVEREAEEDDE
jgi:hypothetical protein